MGSTSRHHRQPTSYTHCVNATQQRNSAVPWEFVSRLTAQRISAMVGGRIHPRAQVQRDDRQRAAPSAGKSVYASRLSPRFQLRRYDGEELISLTARWDGVASCCGTCTRSSQIQAGVVHLPFLAKALPRSQVRNQERFVEKLRYIHRTASQGFSPSCSRQASNSACCSSHGTARKAGDSPVLASKAPPEISPRSLMPAP